MQGAQQERVVGVDVGDDRAQVGLDRVEVLLRLEDARHDRAHLGERAAESETLGEQRHLVADDGGLDERAVVDERLHPGDEHAHPALVGLLADEREGLVGQRDGVDGQVEDARTDDERREQVGARARLLGGAGVVEPVAQQVRWLGSARRRPSPRARPAGSPRRARGRSRRATSGRARGAAAPPADRRRPWRPRPRLDSRGPPSAGRPPRRRGGRARTRGRGRDARPARRHTPGGAGGARRAGGCRPRPHRGGRGGRCRPAASGPRGRGARPRRPARPRASRRGGRRRARGGRGR